MRVLQINSVCGRQSTGKIVSSIQEELKKRGYECVIAYGEKNSIHTEGNYHIGIEIDRYFHGFKTRLFDAHGFASKRATKKLIKFIKEYNPDIIHLHNIHGYYVNIEILFRFIKELNKPVVWTLHDCWPITGHCSYFSYHYCDKWKSMCMNCPQINEYPRSLIDKSQENFLKKKKCFSNINNLSVVTPSEWLANLLKDSILSEYPVSVINNGVNTKVFCERKTDIKKRYGISEKKVILGVASIWNERKGLKYFVELSTLISDEYVIVLIGLNNEQRKHLPIKIIGITHIDSQNELAEWYAAADVFVNPTLEDNYPTTNIEAISCGTPVISFDSGGSGESARFYGISLLNKNASAIYEHLNDVFVKRVNSHDLDNEICVNKYVKLYEKLLTD